MPHQHKAVVPSLIKSDWGLFLAVVQSCFESSVNVLPWINVICGISQVAGMWGQAARKQPKASHIHHGVQPFSLIYLLSMQDLRPHTSAKTKGVFKPFLKFNQKHTGVSFPLATPARSVCDGLRSFICASRCTNRLSIQQTKRKLFGSFDLYISKYPAANVCQSTRKVFLQKPYNALRVAQQRYNTALPTLLLYWKINASLDFSHRLKSLTLSLMYFTIYKMI